MSLRALLFAAVCSLAAAQVEERMQAGLAALQKNDLATARASFEEATRQAPGNAQAWLLLARTYAAQKNQAAAQEAARKAENLGAEDPRILQALANLYAGPIPDAAKAADFGMRYAERSTGDAGVWERLTAFCLTTGQPDRAVQAARRGLQSGNNATLHDLLAQAYLQQKNPALAVDEFAQAVHLNPYDEGLQFRYAQAYIVQSDWPHAVIVLENARKYFDKSPQVELALGVAFYGERDFPKAIDQFLRTIRLAPEVPQPYIFLGRFLEQAGDRLDEISACLRAYREQNPKESLGYVLSAKAMLVRAGTDAPSQNDPALALLEKALSLKEDDPEAHYLAGTILERQGEYARAAVHLERSVALDPKRGVAHFHLARVYARLGRKEDSERERALHETLSMDVNAPDPRGITSVPKVRQ